MTLRLFLLLFLCFAIPAYAEEKAEAGIDDLDPKAGWATKNCREKAAITAMMKARQRKNKNIPEPSLTVSYGSHKLQALDVYLAPKHGRNQPPHPVIFMAHGGGWCMGDKREDWVVTNKVKHWVQRDFVFVSANYRMVPDDAYPTEQAEDIAAAIAFVQKNAAKWKGDGSKIIVMGHSAGAHLVTLVGRDLAAYSKSGVKPWLGTVSLDSGSLDVPGHMTGPHFRMFDEVFGKDEAGWLKVSPIHRLKPGAPPWMGPCSHQWPEGCKQAKAYAEKMRSLGGTASFYPLHVKHGLVNGNLGLPGSYTRSVEEFMSSLDDGIKKRLED